MILKKSNHADDTAFALAQAAILQSTITTGCEIMKDEIDLAELQKQYEEFGKGLNILKGYAK